MQGGLTKPSGMTQGAQSVWDRLLPDAPHLTSADVTLFSQMCEAVAVTERLSSALEKPIVKQPGAAGKLVESPAYAVWQDAHATVLRCATALRMTPASRTSGEEPPAEVVDAPRRRLYAVPEPQSTPSPKPKPRKRPASPKKKGPAK